MSAPDTSTGMLRTPRIPFIDTLRGIALVAMASYHFTWDLEFFGYIEAGTATQGLWKLYARMIATSFLFLVGVSLVLAHGDGIRWRSFAKRLAMVVAAAVVISIGTLIALPQEWIFFGILHHIALSSLLALAFPRAPPLLAGAVALVLAALMVVNTWIVPGLVGFDAFDSRWLAWTGLAEMPPRSNDFVPLFPWLAAVLAGVSVAGLLRKHGGFQRLARLQARPNLLTRAGQHSLAFYLIHQPVLIGLLYLFSLVYPAPAADPLVEYNRSCTASCTAEGNEAGMCERFCSCTSEGLIAQSLMEPMRRGEIDPTSDERVLAIAGECSIRSR